MRSDVNLCGNLLQRLPQSVLLFVLNKLGVNLLAKLYLVATDQPGRAGKGSHDFDEQAVAAI